MKPDLIKSILNQREWQTFECKRAQIKPSKLLETVVAFVNSDGGIIVVGLEDPDKESDGSRLYGIKENEDNISEFINLVRKEIDPPIPLLKKHEIPILNRDGNDVHSLKSGDTFIRNGNRNNKIGSTQIVRLKYEKGVIKYESESSNVFDLESFDQELFRKFKSESGSQTTNEWQFLKDHGLAIQRNNRWELTKGAILLFSKNPAVTLGSKCSIKIAHYIGTKPFFTGEPNFLRRPFSLEGPLLHQITKAIDYFKETIRLSPPKLSGATFKPSLLIPEWVFQEAVTNAVIHRDYSLQDDIHIRFFDDRIEVESPGTYPGHITVHNIRNERFARNPLILRTLNRFVEAPNLDHGEGIDRMFSIMKTYNLYEPLYYPPNLKPHSVLVILFNIHRVEYWDTVSRYIDQKGPITNKEARAITGITDTIKMNRLLTRWVKQGLLIKIDTGSKKGTSYNKPGLISDLLLFSKWDDNKNEI